MNDSSQAVRLPKACRFDGKEVFIKKIGNAVILFPLGNPWQALIDSLNLFSSDFMENRAQPDVQTREGAD